MIQLRLIPFFMLRSLRPLTQCESSDYESPASPRPVDLQGHRGARGLFPESTLIGFQAAVEHGMTTLEWDLHTTRDGHFVVFHDHELTPENQRGADILSPYFLYATPEFVARCHAEGIRIVPWTVNEVEDMHKLLEAGVDGIISDYPDRLQKTHEKWLKISEPFPTMTAS